jgi:hypothetical protein
MTFITDDYGNITPVEKLGPEFLELAQSTAIRPETAPGITRGNYGNPGSGLCCADHIHKHTDEWKNDIEIQNIRKNLEYVTEVFAEEVVKDIYDIVAWGTDIALQITKLSLMVLTWVIEKGINVSPYLINALIRALNRAIGFNIKEVEIDGEKIDLSGLRDKLEELL